MSNPQLALSEAATLTSNPPCMCMTYGVDTLRFFLSIFVIVLLYGFFQVTGTCNHDKVFDKLCQCLWQARAQSVSRENEQKG